VGPVAHAARSPGLGDLLLGSPSDHDGQKLAPLIARYVDESGDTGFVLDRSAPMTLLRYDDSPEIWVLTPQPASHGDVIYKNDVGEPVLRATRLGGMTVFSVDHPGGAAAALVGDAPQLRPTMILTPNALLQHLAQASAHASRAAQKLVVFDAPDVTPQTASLVADAATIVAEAMVGLSRDNNGRKLLAKVNKVVLMPGRKPQAQLDQGVLRVTIVPMAPAGGLRQEVACRPSSRRIVVALKH
jgi:hypothetical protein